jgi:hypothetical protein
MSLDLKRDFLIQRQNARKRGIAWELTFDEWVVIWTACALLGKRGRGRERYCMARKGDVGPYSVANVYICTNAQNVKDFRARSGESHNLATRIGHLTAALSKRGWTRRTDKYRSKPYQVAVGTKYIGSFATRGEAARVHRAAVLERLAAFGVEATWPLT